MALKDLSTGEAADILVQLAPLMDNITSDEKIMERIGVQSKTEGLTIAGKYAMAMHRVFSSVPLLLVDHRADLFGIVAIINRKDPAEVAAQPIVKTINEIKAIFNDEDLRSFFGAFASTGQTL